MAASCSPIPPQGPRGMERRGILPLVFGSSLKNNLIIGRVRDYEKDWWGVCVYKGQFRHKYNIVIIIMFK